MVQLTRQQRRAQARQEAWDRLKCKDGKPMRDPVGGGFLFRRERRELAMEAAKMRA